MTPSEVAHHCGVPLKRLIRLAEAGPEAYKPTWNQGTEAKPRWIREPHDELKRVQRRLLRSIFVDVPPHPAAFAAAGRGGTVAAAESHVSQDYLLHLDLSSFFPSVSPRRVFERLIKVGFQEGVASLVTGLTTVADQLPQGAPSSPAIADLVLFPMDARIHGLCELEGWTYTRYVDDIAVSGSSRVVSYGRRILTRIIEDEGWALNEKGGPAGPDRRKEMLGLTVGSRVSVPREVRSSIRSLLRLAEAGRVELSAGELNRVRGRLAWIFAVNPRQGRKLRLLLERIEGT